MFFSMPCDGYDLYMYSFISDNVHACDLVWDNIFHSVVFLGVFSWKSLIPVALAKINLGFTQILVFQCHGSSWQQTFIHTNWSNSLFFSNFCFENIWFLEWMELGGQHACLGLYIYVITHTDRPFPKIRASDFHVHFLGCIYFLTGNRLHLVYH